MKRIFHEDYDDAAVSVEASPVAPKPSNGKSTAGFLPNLVLRSPEIT
jgi:hypothetical protein